MDMETIRHYLEGYWEYSKLHLGVLALVFVVIVTFAKHRRRAFAVLLMGLYVTAGLYFLSICDEPEIGMEWSTGFGIFLAVGLVVGVIFYYFAFVKAAYK